MKKISVLLLVFAIVQAFSAFSNGTILRAKTLPNSYVINKVVWNGREFFLLGKSAKTALFIKYSSSNGQIENLSSLMPDSYINLNGCVKFGDSFFVVGNGRKKAVIGKYLPSTNSFIDLSKIVPYYWKYILDVTSNGKLLAIVGEGVNGKAVMGIYDPVNGKLADLSNEIDKIGFLQSVASNGKGFLAVGLRTNMPERPLMISYIPSSKKVVDLSSKLSSNYVWALDNVVWDGNGYVFVGGYAFGYYKDNFEDLSYELNSVHLLSNSSNTTYEYGSLRGISFGNGQCIIFGNGVLFKCDLKSGKIEGVDKFIANYKYTSLISAAWNGKEFLFVGNDGGKMVLFLYKP